MKFLDCAIGAVVKDEAPYLLEWVAYYKLLGFSIIIADNGGDDDTSLLLSKLHNAGLIYRIDLTFIKNQVQLPAYRAILRVAKKNKVKVLGFLDIDEFFTITHPIQNLSSDYGANYILNRFKKENIKQLSFHWLVYGSKTEQQDITEPVLKRFTHHANFKEQWNCNIKSFVKVKSMFNWFNYVFLGPAVFSAHRINWDYKQWVIDNRQIDITKEPDMQWKYWDNNYITHNSGLVHDSGLVLHFQNKTWKEYQVKIKRGDGAFIKNKNNKQYFDNYDFNDISTPINSDVLEELQLEINNIKDNKLFKSGKLKQLSFIQKLKNQLLSFGLSDVVEKKKRRYQYLHKIFVK